MCSGQCVRVSEVSPGFCVILDTFSTHARAPTRPFLKYFHYEKEVNHAERAQRNKEIKKRLQKETNQTSAIPPRNCGSLLRAFNTFSPSLV